MASPDDHNDARRNKMSSSGLYDAASRLWKRSYAGDYVGLSTLVVAYILVKLMDEPFHQMFRLNDYRLQHPHAEIERVPVFMLIIYAVAIPAGVIAAWSLILRPDLHKMHVGALGLATTIITTLFLTDFFKDLIGRPRPDLIARCKPDPSAPIDQLITIDYCTETDHHLLHDGWRSFPSGHSSFAFAGLGWLSLYLASQTRCLRPNVSFTTAIICVSPLTGAAMIGISRLEDYRHDVEDVIVGSVLGLLVATLNWHRYFPPLLSEDCSEPYVSTSHGRPSPSAGFERVRDEEEGYLGQRESFSISSNPDRPVQGVRSSR